MGNMDDAAEICVYERNYFILNVVEVELDICLFIVNNNELKSQRYLYGSATGWVLDFRQELKWDIYV